MIELQVQSGFIMTLVFIHSYFYKYAINLAEAQNAYIFFNLSL